MMRFLVRELAGWLLIGLGLLVFFVVYDLLTDRENPGLLQTGPLVIIGVVLFRGGLHLLKVAVAARLSLRAQDAAGRDTVRRTPAGGRG
jgi:uncharacterized membrane protein YgdD (TMEM256/DUF423 family)